MENMKEYLGDGMYVEVDHGMLKLTTEDGYRATNTIYLEPEVYFALTQYFERATAKAEASRAAPEEPAP